jgi:hypothetical protein
MLGRDGGMGRGTWRGFPDLGDCGVAGLDALSCDPE